MDIEVAAIAVSNAPYGVFGIIYLLIWYLISGLSLYISIIEIKKYSKENCYSVMGTISHIECRLTYHSKYDLNKHGSRKIIIDRVPDHESLVPMNKPVAGTIHYTPVYTYTFEGEVKSYTERCDKRYDEFKRKEYYKGVVKELRITKKEKDVLVVGYGTNKFSMIISVVFMILGIAQTVGFVFLLANGIWTFV